MNFASVLEKRYENSHFEHLYTNSFALIREGFALIRESFAFIRESYALIREKYNFFSTKMSPICFRTLPIMSANEEHWHYGLYVLYLQNNKTYKAKDRLFKIGESSDTVLQLLQVSYWDMVTR